MKHHLVRHRLALLIIGVPMLLAALYFTLMSRERYVSTAVLTVRRAGNEAPSLGGLSMLLSGTASASVEDTRYLREYLHSLGLLQALDRRLKIRSHFESARSDVLMRLETGTSQ